MLDLLISYINFLILSISYLVKCFVFNPPKPPYYIVLGNGEKEELLFLFKVGKDKSESEYRRINDKKVKFNIKYIKLRYNNKNNSLQYLPTLIIRPKKPYNKCIIYCQGNSGDLGTSLFESYEIAIKCNSLVITFEYPGYGLCKNDIISENEFYRRIQVIYKFVTKDLKYNSNQIILYGFSLGTGIAFDLACRRKFSVAGLILQSPFLSILRTMYNIKKTKYFDLFNNCDKAKNLCTKTLFIHGNSDEIVPFIHGKILSTLIPKKYFYEFLTIENADHINLFNNNKDSIFQKINIFINYCTNIDNNSFIDEDSNEDIADTNPSALDGLKDISKKLSIYNDIFKSDDIGLNKSDEMRMPSFYIDNKKELNTKIDACTQINYSLVNKLTNNNKNSNDNKINNNIQSETIPIKPCLKISNKIYGNKIKNKNQFSNNYYYVNLRDNSKKNIFSTNKSKIIYINHKKNYLNGNSLISNNSTINKINNSKDYSKI